MKRGRLLVQLANNQTREVIQERLSPPVAVPPILPAKQNDLVQVAYEVCMQEPTSDKVTNDDLQVIQERLSPPVAVPPILPAKQNDLVQVANDVCMQEPTSDKVTNDDLQNVEILETEGREKSLSPSVLQNSEVSVDNHRSIDNTVNEEQPNDGAIGDFSASDTDDDYQLDPARIESSTDSDISTSVPRQIPVLDDIDSERLPKKRIRNEKNWAKNKKKLLVNTGQAYVTSSGREKRAKKMGMSCGQKCRLKCSLKFNEDQRQTIFDHFYNMGNRSRQRDFISKCMEVTSPRKYRREEASRKLNYAYYLYLDNTKRRVCKLFFKNTLDITNSAITTVQNVTNTEGFTEKERRGMHSQHHSLPDTAKQSVRDHINRFPRIESHYCRADTRREYLEGDLTISTMYRLYVQYCEENGLEAVKNSMYAHIFNTEFNIAFFKPKKDQCSKCEAFKNASPEAKLDLQDGYDMHITEKKLSRVMKKRDVDRAKNSNGNILIFDYDLQAVVPLPQGEVSTFYYKSKLNFINFTVCDIINKDGMCYAWHEGIAKRGANEIGSCVFSLLQNVGPKIEIIFYSDNCGGQNKNKFILSMYMYAVQALFINIITHNFLIAGHTQNDADNIHSLIEREKRRLLRSGPIFTPAQMAMVLKSAKKTGKSYTVNEIGYQQIYDWKKLSQMVKNFSIDENGQKIVWGDIKCIQVKKEDPYKFGYKSSFSELDFKIVNTRRKQRGRISENITLERAYDEAPAIPNHKKRDLISLCTANLIPQCHHSFYERLKITNNQENESGNSDDECL